MSVFSSLYLRSRAAGVPTTHLEPLKTAPHSQAEFQNYQEVKSTKTKEEMKKNIIYIVIYKLFFFNTFLLKHLLLMPCRNPPPWSHHKLLIFFKHVKGRTGISPNPASAEFFLTFNINWLDLVSCCELGKILHLVLLKVGFKENYFHKQAVTTDKGSACTKGLKYRRTTRTTQMLLGCAFKKLCTETIVNAGKEEGKTTCN